MLEWVEKQESGIIIRQKVTAIDIVILEECRKKFRGLVSCGTVKGAYEDMTWVATNQKKNYHFRFAERQDELSEVCREAGADYGHVIRTIKAVIIMLFGMYNLEILRSIVSYTINELCSSRFGKEVSPLGDSRHGACLAYYIDIISLFPEVSPEYIKECEKKLNAFRAGQRERRKESRHPCSLNEFSSSFKLDYIMEDFPKHCTREEADYFAPLLLYWKITCVLPLRVTDFCVTPYECLRKDGGRFYLTVRRTRLKGKAFSFRKIHTYMISGDYDSDEYEIPQWLYEMIDDYRKKTQGYEHPYELLFSVDYMLSFSRAHHTGNREKVFSDRELNEMLQAFYLEVVTGQYGYTIVDEDVLLSRCLDEETQSYEMYDKEIMYLKLKHTRHLAMINLVYRGCNPMMVWEFAGHVPDSVSSNYYGNVSKMARCAVKQLYDRHKYAAAGNTAGIVDGLDFHPLSILKDEDAAFEEVDGGRCYSKAFLSNSIRDCAKCGGTCSRCRHFLPEGMPQTDQLEQKVDEEMEYIRKMFRNQKLEAALDEYAAALHELETDIRNLAGKYWAMEELKNRKERRL